MTCGEVSKHLDRANSPRWGGLTARVREHLEQCRSCKALWDFLSSPETAELTPELRSRINQSAEKSLEPVVCVVRKKSAANPSNTKSPVPSSTDRVCCISYLKGQSPLS